MSRRHPRTDLGSRGPRYRISWYWADVKKAFLFGCVTGGIIVYLLMQAKGA